MANHYAAVTAALLLTTFLLAAVAFSGADASPTVRPDKAWSAVFGGLADDAAAAAVVDPESECDDDNNYHSSHKHHHKHHDKDEYPDHKHHDGDEYPDHKHLGDHNQDEYPDDPEHQQESPYLEADSMEQELCSDYEEPKTPLPPPCDCEEPKEPELKCTKVYAVRDGETCYSVGQCAGLRQDDFLRFNPNICCDNLFVGQWVCLDATCDA